MDKQTTNTVVGMSMADERICVIGSVRVGLNETNILLYRQGGGRIGGGWQTASPSDVIYDRH